MKKAFTLLFVLLPFYLMAIDDVSMEAYDQPYGERASISLKNNTNEPIRNVSFLLNYLDAKGNPISYEEFSIKIDIAPGKTKMIKISGPGSYDFYSIGSKGYHGDAKGYRVTYELQRYNLETNEENTDNVESIPSLITPTFSIYESIFFILFFIGIFVLVGAMAKRRNRNPLLWVFLSMIFTPILIILLLAIIGRSK